MSNRSLSTLSQSDVVLDKLYNLDQDLAVVCIAVCTYKRPQMLRRCLEAIARLDIPSGCRTQTIVIDNEPLPVNEAIATAFDVQYVHEPQRGITQARNRALVTALARGADYIAFIDDDAWPTSGWLTTLIETARLHNADVVRGRTEFVYPEPRPYWATTARTKLVDGAKGGVRRVSGRDIVNGNVLMAARLLTPEGLSLRYDPRFALTGGEDTDLFCRAEEQGAVIMCAPAALMFEEVVAGRLTYWRLIRRHYQYAMGEAIRQMGKNRSARVLRHAAHRAALGLVYMAVAAAVFPVRRRSFKKYALLGGRRFMFAAGGVAALCGVHYEGYREVDGY